MRWTMGVEVRTTIRIDQAALQRAMTDRDGVVWQGVQRGAARVRDQAKMNLTAAGRVDTGQLRNAIVSEVVSDGQQVVGRVIAQTSYAKAVHDGTGVHGPKGTPIVPRRAKFLRFRPKGSTSFVFAPSVEGVEPTPFLTDALERLTLSDFV